MSKDKKDDGETVEISVAAGKPTEKLKAPEKPKGKGGKKKSTIVKSGVESVAKPSKATDEADVDMHPMLTPEEKENLKKEARSNILAQLKKEAEDSFLRTEEKKELRRHRQKTGKVDEDEMVDFVVDLAEFADSILINNVRYFHGFSYRVPRHVARGMADICYRTWDHQNEIDGIKFNPRKRKNLRLSNKGAA